MSSVSPRTDGEVSRTGFGISSRAIALGMIVGIPSSAFFLYLAVGTIKWSQVWSVLRRAQTLEIIAAVAALALVYLLQAERWRLIARAEWSAPRRQLLGWVVGGVAVNNLIPGRPGEFLRGYWLSRGTKRPLARALATIAIDRAADVVLLLALVLVSLPAVEHPSWFGGLVIGAGIIASVLIIALGASWWYTHRTRRGRVRASGRVHRTRLRRILSDVVRAAAAIVNRPVTLLGVIVTSAAVWLTWSGAAWLVADAIGISLSLPQVVFVAGVVNLGVAIPSSPGFVGTFHWLTTSTVAGFGIPTSEAFAYSILLHALWYLPTTAVGVTLAIRAGADRWPLASNRPTPVEGTCRLG